MPAAADAQQARVHGEAFAARVVRRIVASLQALRCDPAELDDKIDAASRPTGTPRC